MDTQEALALARDYVYRVKQILDYDSAYLFGSYAAGHQDQNSDVDIGIIVSETDENYLDLMKNLYRIRRELDVRIEPHLYIQGHDPLDFAECVVKSGIRL